MFLPRAHVMSLSFCVCVSAIVPHGKRKMFTKEKKHGNGNESGKERNVYGHSHARTFARMAHMNID